MQQSGREGLGELLWTEQRLSTDWKALLNGCRTPGGAPPQDLHDRRRSLMAKARGMSLLETSVFLYERTSIP